MWRPLPLTVCLTLAFASTAAGQDPVDPYAEPASTADANQDSAPSPQPVSVHGISDDYRVGPGDVIDVRVIDHAELRQSLRISNAGEISFPMLGLVPVNDLTVFEIEVEIADRLREAKLIQDADVLVSISTYEAKPFFVWGAVANPGEFVMSQRLSVTDAILMAGGLAANAANEAMLYRREPLSAAAAETEAPSGEPTTESLAERQSVKIDLVPFKQGRYLDTAVPLRRGDVLVVPRRTMNMFFVVGEVFDPRNFPYPPDRTITASQAISRAQGPLPTAKLSDGKLIRYDEEGTRQELDVNYAAILEGRQADFPIQANDIIFIPGSKVKTVTHGLLLLTDTMVMQQSFRIGRRLQLPESPNRDRPDDGQ
jgi:polysaccharide export outer membrane protein